MRILNDNGRQRESPQMGFLPLLSHSLSSALGIGTVIISPFPMILSHLRLPEPWPKITGLVGAALALTVLEVPLALVALLFVFGLYVADTVARGPQLWRLIIYVGLLSVVLGSLEVVTLSLLSHSNILVFWKGMINGLLDQLQMIVPKTDNKIASSFVELRSLLYYQGPFLFVSSAIFSVWLSVGMAAHLGWFPADHSLCSERLRKTRISIWVSSLFVVFFAAKTVAQGPWLHYCEGLFRVISTIVFIEGCIVLSSFFAARPARLRTLVYVFTMVFTAIVGFFPVASLGAFSPWYFRKRGTL
ncbi:MAG: hypothetical protein HY537_11030 [Deltaproteobacteria bacterium]|nr:hypothetical protein [Deltaproteobacteria bacterium]